MRPIRENSDSLGPNFLTFLPQGRQLSTISAVPLDICPKISTLYAYLPTSFFILFIFIFSLLLDLKTIRHYL